VENEVNSRLTVPTEEKQRITNARNEKVGHQETKGNRREVRNGDQITTEKRVGTMRNCRETGSGWRRRAYADICIKPPPPPHHALNNITKKRHKSRHSGLGQTVPGDSGYLSMGYGGKAGWPERQPDPGLTLQTAHFEGSCNLILGLCRWECGFSSRISPISSY
jgi:hypothetical protein